MTEIRSDVIGQTGDALHDALCRIELAGILRAGKRLPERVLEVVVEIFIRIELRRVGRQVEQPVELLADRRTPQFDQRQWWRDIPPMAMDQALAVQLGRARRFRTSFLPAAARC